MGIGEVVSLVMNLGIKPLLDKFFPDAQQRVEAEQFITKQLASLNNAQVSVNLKEAENPRLFISGWRPFIGWVCGGGFAYAVVGKDILNWIVNLLNGIWGYTIPPLPAPDLTLMFEVLIGLLGLGGYRSWEKINGVASK